ncbi:uncharacterized protein LOC122372448 [Amphibalanus amphitrite]|uniref:uncharacterized protein LOC122372448 n=1 Tax=Amphibalanus amphitrite TaxID=1232801 RepID=UPI001C8FF414|nr:uncharacterized protein LOC122372448 [Amphibalanus amphitrite]
MPYQVPPGTFLAPMPQQPPPAALVQQSSEATAVSTVHRVDAAQRWLTEDNSALSAESCRLYASPDVSAGYVRVPPGGRKADAVVHWQSVHAVVMSGEGELVLSDSLGQLVSSHPLRQQDVFSVGPGAVYRVENTGSVEMLLFITMYHIRSGLQFYQPPAAACPGLPGARPPAPL